MTDKQQIKEFVEANPSLVQKKATSNPELFVLKYTNKVFYDNLWTPELQECRGTIIDANYNVVSRPFTKVFNRNERGIDIPLSESCTYVRKVNGFMAAVTTYRGEILISTTGSIDSSFVDIARKHLAPYLNSIDCYLSVREYEGYGTQTFIFEIVDKDDPHIVSEEEGAYLIGHRTNSWKSYSASEQRLDDLAIWLGCLRPEWDTGLFSEIVEGIKEVTHEGFMVYGDSGVVLKMKSPHYLAKKALMRMGSKQVGKMFDQPEEFRKRLDEEFYDLYNHILKYETKESWGSIDERGRRAWIEGYFSI